MYVKSFLVLPTGIEPVSIALQAITLTINVTAANLAVVKGIEPSSPDRQSSIIAIILHDLCLAHVRRNLTSVSARIVGSVLALDDTCIKFGTRKRN